MVEKQGIKPRTDKEAMDAMNSRKVVRSSKTEEELLPEQIINLLNKQRDSGISETDWQLMRSVIMPRYEEAVKKEKEEADAVKAQQEEFEREAIKRYAERFAEHLKSFRNLILDEE